MKGQEPEPVHPNSLAARAARDPSLRRRIREGRKRANADLRAAEAWASGGFTSPSGVHDLQEVEREEVKEEDAETGSE